MRIVTSDPPKRAAVSDLARSRTTVADVERVLVATDSDATFNDVDAALAGSSTTVTRVRSGREVRAAVIGQAPDLVVLDLQIGSMGGMATCMDLRLEEGAGRLDPHPILLLLDRDADVFIARRSGAEGWLVKPTDAGRLRRAAAALESGQTFTETGHTAVS